MKISQNLCREQAEVVPNITSYKPTYRYESKESLW